MKRKLSLRLYVFLSVLLTVCAFFGFSANASIINDASIYGDINSDSEISTSDLILLAKNLSGKIDKNKIDALAADCYVDGRINSDDLLAIIKYLVSDIDLPINLSDGEITITAPPVSTTVSSSTEQFENYKEDVLRLVNAEREKNSLPPLKYTEELNKAAAVRAGELAALFDSKRPNGEDFSTVLNEFGISYNISEENIAIGDLKPDDVVRLWLESQEQRENILNPEFTHIGVAHSYDANQMFGHFWVQIFIKDNNNETTVTTTPTGANSEYAVDVLNFINSELAIVGAESLKLSVSLDNAAQVRAVESAGALSKKRPDGRTPTSVLSDFGIVCNNAKEFCINYSSTSSAFATPADAFQNWLSVSGNKAQILTSGYTHLGLGYVYSPGSSYEHYLIIYFLNVSGDIGDEYYPVTTTTTTVTTITTVTTTNTAATTTTTAPVTAVSQVDLFRFIYGTWFENSLDVIGNRAGLTLTGNVKIPISITSLGSGTLAQAGGSWLGNQKGTITNIAFNVLYIKYNTIIPAPDGLFPPDYNTMPVDTVFAHELTHGLCYLNMNYNMISTIPKWYMEGLAESVVGSNRLEDYKDNISYTSYGSYSGKPWQIGKGMIANLSNSTTSATTESYVAGYILVNWLDNYGTVPGQFTSSNGGRIKVLNNEIKTAANFDTACTTVFGKTSAQLLSEFKAKAALVTNYTQWEQWLLSECNIKCADGLNDTLCNQDRLITDVVPNNGSPKPHSAVTDTIIYNGITITLEWIF